MGWAARDAGLLLCQPGPPLPALEFYVVLNFNFRLLQTHCK